MGRQLRKRFVADRLEGMPKQTRLSIARQAFVEQLEADEQEAEAARLQEVEAARRFELAEMQKREALLALNIAQAVFFVQMLKVFGPRGRA